MRAVSVAVVLVTQRHEILVRLIAEVVVRHMVQLDPLPATAGSALTVVPAVVEVLADRPGDLLMPKQEKAHRALDDARLHLEELRHIKKALGRS